MSLVRASGLALTGRLHPLDLQLEAGTLTALIGPNGSGKTSLLHALARIGSASGTVSVHGQVLAVAGPALRTRLLSFLPASRDLPWAIPARDVVALSGANAVAIEAVIERTELGPIADRPADRLSTGERSRVLIARALAAAPHLLLLDEPTSNLDPLWQIRLMDLLREEVATPNRAALVAMHDLDAAGAYADRLIVMDGGRVAADGPPELLLNDPVIAKVFGIKREEAAWRPVNPPAGRRSSQ